MIADFFLLFTRRLRLSKPWRYKFPLIFTFTYVFFYSDVLSELDVLRLMAFSLMTSIGFAGIAYISNDFSDRTQDEAAGKKNGLSGMGKGTILALFALFLVFALFPWLSGNLPADQWSLALVGLEMALFLLYALPPFRLKERRWAGLITDAAYAHVVPALLASWTFYLASGQTFSEIGCYLILLSVWQFFSGMRNILSHQIADYSNDVESGARTAAVAWGLDKSAAIQKFAFLLPELLAFITLLLFATADSPWVLAFLVPHGLIASWQFLKGKKHRSESPIKRFTTLFVDELYNQWLPLIVLGGLIFHPLHIRWVLLLHILLFANWWHRPAQWLKAKVLQSSLFSTQTDKKGLAIVSGNRNKYSETFIHSLFTGLENVVAVFSDGLFPSSVSFDKGETFQSLSQKSWWRRTSPVESLKHSLRKSGAEVVLVEYGPSGVEMMEVCKDLNLPMIVHFHGYDAYRDDVMENQGRLYPMLFTQAAAVVVVSHAMRNQLLHLGCPEDKMAVIPCGVQSLQFTPSATFSQDKKILYCGRFVAKKNPLGTLKIVSSVLMDHPDATFHMIGDGPLLEEARTFAGTLECGERIVFEGVMSQPEVAEKMRECAVFVQLSQKTPDNDSEGTPLGMMEAMSSGMLVLGTRHAGIQEVIQHEINGFLVDENTAQITLNELLAHPEKFAAIRSNARQTILENYTIEHYHGALQDLINRVAEEAKSVR